MLALFKKSTFGKLIYGAPTEIDLFPVDFFTRKTHFALLSFSSVVLSGEKYSNGVENRTSILLEHCLAKICQTSIMLGT